MSVLKQPLGLGRIQGGGFGLIGGIISLPFSFGALDGQGGTF